MFMFAWSHLVPLVLLIPIMPLARRGKFDRDLLALVRANVREPLQVEGDLFAMAACDQRSERQRRWKYAGLPLGDIQDLSDRIIDASRRAMREAIRRLPPGTYRNRMTRWMDTTSL